MRTITFKVDGKKVAEEMLLPGRVITLPQQPEKRYMNFAGWENLPEDCRMPEQNLVCTAIFKPIVCTATFMLDGDVYYKVELVANEKLCPPTSPEREGMIFVGWDNLPDVMPPYDFIATARYEKRKYKIVYYVDNVMFAEESYPWGETVTPQQLPDTTDKIFEGWDHLPAVMPMHDVSQVNARFHYRDFKVTYVINNVPVTYSMVPCHSKITPPSVAPREGKVIIGWVNMPEDGMMPAYDIVVEAIWGNAEDLEKMNKKTDKKSGRAQRKAEKEAKKAARKAKKDDADMKKAISAGAEAEIRRKMQKLMR